MGKREAASEQQTTSRGIKWDVGKGRKQKGEGTVVRQAMQGVAAMGLRTKEEDRPCSRNKNQTENALGSNQGGGQLSHHVSV